MSALRQPIDDRYGPGVRVTAWLQPEHGSSAGAARRELLRALGIRSGARRYPVQARAAKGDAFVLRMEAHYSPYEKQSRGALRSYLERREAQGPDLGKSIVIDGEKHPANVLQNQPLEQWLDRWSIWLNPSEKDVDPYVVIHALTEALGRRYGLTDEDVYAVQHYDGPEVDSGWHLHVVVPRRDGMDLDRREVLGEIGRAVAREALLARAVERALERARNGPAAGAEGAVGSGWDLAPTARQMEVLRRAGQYDPNITRGQASLVIERIIGERSWYHERGMDR
jgi:hypothetical protein